MRVGLHVAAQPASRVAQRAANSCSWLVSLELSRNFRFGFLPPSIVHSTGLVGAAFSPVLLKSAVERQRVRELIENGAEEKLGARPLVCGCFANGWKDAQSGQGRGFPPPLVRCCLPP